MGACIRVELVKLRRRPAVWALAVTWLILGVVFGYLLPYLLYRAGAGQTDFSIPLEGMLPASIVENAIQGFPLFGLALALVVGGLAVGSEYGWGTWTTLLVQRPDRLRVLVAKLAAIGVVLLTLTVASFVTATLAAGAVALLEGAGLSWPSAADVVRGLGVGWLILATGAAIGIAGATLLRGATLIVGLGVLYVSVVEGLIGAFARQSAVLHGDRQGAARHQRRLVGERLCPVRPSRRHHRTRHGLGRAPGPRCGCPDPLYRRASRRGTGRLLPAGRDRRRVAGALPCTHRQLRPSTATRRTAWVGSAVSWDDRRDGSWSRQRS